MTTMTEMSDTYGFQSPRNLQSTAQTGAAALTTVALGIGTLVGFTAISIGIARADAVDTILNNEVSVFAIALLLGALFVAATLSKALSPRRNARRQSLRDGSHPRYSPRR